MDPEIGQVIAARYEVLGHAGSDVSGEVYRVHDEQSGEVRALKVIRQTAARSPKLLESLRRQVRVLRGLSHPNMAQIHALGDFHGSPFLVSEYVEGENLKTFIGRVGRVDPEGFLPIARQISAVVEFLHAQNIIHRDLKPAAFVFSPGGALKLRDFGMAREAEGVQTIALPGGAPAHMPPEQLLGRRLDARSDIYSLGGIFFELLAGRPPHQDADAISRYTQPPPRVTDLAPATPAAISAMIEKCLQPEMENRFPSIAGIIEVLEQPDSAQSPPVSAQPPTGSAHAPPVSRPPEPAPRPPAPAEPQPTSTAAQPRPAAAKPERQPAKPPHAAPPGPSLISRQSAQHPPSPRPVEPEQPTPPAPRSQTPSAPRPQTPPAEPRTKDTLKERLGDDPGKPRDVVATLLLVVKKLDEMAQAGLYHPPLSPDAIRLRGANAVEVDAAPPPEPGKTLIVTESKYLAPECLFARPTEPKTVALSDVYSLGFIAYEWLLGGGNFEKQFPFEGAPQENFQWMQWHGDRAAAVKPPAEVCPWIPQPLSRLVEQMLAKDAAARPAAYPALIEELESIRKRIEDTHHVSNLTPAEHGSGTLAGKRSLGLRTMPAWQRILLLCAAAVVVVLVLFGLAGRGG